MARWFLVLRLLSGLLHCAFPLSENCAYLLIRFRVLISCTVVYMLQAYPTRKFHYRHIWERYLCAFLAATVRFCLFRSLAVCYFSCSSHGFVFLVSHFFRLSSSGLLFSNISSAAFVNVYIRGSRLRFLCLCYNRRSHAYPKIVYWAKLADGVAVC